MQGKFEVRYLPIAVDDLNSIFDYISEKNIIAAEKFIDKLDSRIKLLEQQPQLGVVPRNIKLRSYGYRVLIVEVYLIFYIIKKKRIEIHRIIHGSRNLDAIIGLN